MQPPEGWTSQCKKPTISDLVSLLQSHVGQQAAWEDRQKEETPCKNSTYTCSSSYMGKCRSAPPLFLSIQKLTSLSKLLPAMRLSISPMPQQVSFISEPRSEKLTDDNVEHFLITFNWWQTGFFISYHYSLAKLELHIHIHIIDCIHMDMDDSLDYE